MAAGITVEREKLGALRAFFEERAAADVFRLQDEATLQIDAALAAEGATLALLDTLEKAGPSAPATSRRSSCCRAMRCRDAAAGGRQSHPRRPAVRERRPHPGHGVPGGRYGARRVPVQESRATIHVAGTLSGNYWNGSRTVQFRMTDAALAS